MYARTHAHTYVRVASLCRARLCALSRLRRERHLFGSADSRADADVGVTRGVACSADGGGRVRVRSAVQCTCKQAFTHASDSPLPSSLLSTSTSNPIHSTTRHTIPSQPPPLLSLSSPQNNPLTSHFPQNSAPYIQVSAGHIAHDDPRSRGYNFIARTVFLSKEDMEYYDTECAAHGEIKALLKGKVEDGPPLVVYMDG